MGNSSYGARRHDEEDCGYINASHLRSKDYEQPEWDYIAAQARPGLHARNKDMIECMRIWLALQHQACTLFAC